MNIPITFAIETIPWQECARQIQNCTALNRSLSERRVDTITRSMSQDRFMTTHQGIAYDPAGNPIDGQHRLASAARAKKDLTILVARYTSAAYAKDAMAIFDSGRSRSTADGLAIGGVMPKENSKEMTAICNVMISLMGARGDGNLRTTLDLQETAEFYKAHRESVRWAIAAFQSKRGGSYLRAAFAISYEVSPKKTAELAAQIQEGVGLPGTAAALWNRSFADGTLTTTGGFSHRREALLKALRILKAHVAGEKPPAKLYASDDAFNWFMAQRGVAVKPLRHQETETSIDSLKDKILKAIPAHGARACEIARAVNRSTSQVSQKLMDMVNKGSLTKPRVGFYLKTGKS